MAMTKVNLIVGGVQKGGTTTLSQHLRNHPMVAFGDTKELHVASDKDQFSDHGYDLADVYPSRFSHVLSAENRTPRYLADATPVYCYWPNAIERLASYNPDAKLILIFRDPIERAFSHWQMEYARDADTVSFPDAIRSGRARVMTDPLAPGYHRVYSYVERGFYSAQLRRVFASFPRSQVLVLDNRDLRDELDNTLNRIWAFLGLDAPDSPPQQIRANPAPKFDYGYEFDHRDGAYLYSLFRWDIEAFGELSGLDVSHWGAAYRAGNGIVTADILRERSVLDTEGMANLAYASVAGPANAVHQLHEAPAIYDPGMADALTQLKAERDVAVSKNRILQLEIDSLKQDALTRASTSSGGTLSKWLGRR